MKKIIVGVLLFLLIAMLIFGCTPQKPPSEPPKLTITIDDKEIRYVVAKNKWDGAIYDREDTFQTIMIEGSGFEIPYFEIGKKVSIRFLDSPPEQFLISDILINDKGQQIYTDREVTNIPVELNDDECSFEIKKHFASGLSSIYIENKKEIRGFRMYATWGENECEYAFIIKTD